MAPYRGNYKGGLNAVAATLNKEELLEKYLKEFRVDQCPLFLQHKCQQHRPFTCFHWHFQNQRRRRPVRRSDGTFNYSADAYCTKYDETTGICPDGDECPYLHRTAGDTERRYHLKYYKTGMCVHDTDNRGFCVKNGPHCAFAHGANDLRAQVYDIRELRAIENGDADCLADALNSLDKERLHLLNSNSDDPKWLDTTYVLANYKTEPCKKPPRLCRQGYACPQYHNNKDKRRSPKKYKYRSTPCPQVKSGDEWGDPVACEAGDACQYCHTRTEQQFHPEIYKSTKCNDIQNTSYCPRGAFCAFAHVEQETVSLESPSSDHTGPNLGDILSHVLPDEKINGHEIQSEFSGLPTFGLRAPGSHLRNGSITPPFEENGIASPIESTTSVSRAVSQPFQNGLNSLVSGIDSSLLTGVKKTNTTNAILNGNSLFGGKNRFLSGDHASRESMLRRQVYSIESDPTLSPVEKAQRKASLIMEASTGATTSSSVTNTNGFGGFFSSAFNGDVVDALGYTLEDLGLPLSEGSKSRKSSGFSETTTKSRQGSGFEINSNNTTKCRNLSGGSLMNGGGSSSGASTTSSASSENGCPTSSVTNPVHIPNSGHHNKNNNNNNASQNNSPNSVSFLPTSNGQENQTSGLGMSVNQLGLFDLTDSSQKTSEAAKDMEISRLKEELNTARTRLTSWDESLAAARNACEVWKKETALATKKYEMVCNKMGQLQKEIESLQQQNNGNSMYLHSIKRVSELKTLPAGVLKTIEWQLKKDLMEVEKALRYQESGGIWPPPSSTNRLFDFGNSSAFANGVPTGTELWGQPAVGLIQSHQQHLFESLAQQ